MHTNLMESVLKAVVVLLCFDFKPTEAQDFSYDGTLGPDHWGEQYNGCSGKFQSPINIDLLEVKERIIGDIILEGFDEQPLGGDLVNNGHTVVLQLNYENNEPTASGGPLGGTFRFAQLHFHWGDNDTYGSEDRINNQSFPAELHMVFYNTLYDSFHNALGHREGVAVLAFFFSLQTEDNPNYSDLAILLDSLQKPDHHVPFFSAPTLGALGGTEYHKYFTYIGSLTTPPCSEEVVWIDFEVPIMISRAQIEKFRHIYNHAGEPLTHNFRPIQPLNNRIVSRNVPAPEGFVEGVDEEEYSNRIDNSRSSSDTITFFSKKNSSNIITSGVIIVFSALFFNFFI